MTQSHERYGSRYADDYPYVYPGYGQTDAATRTLEPPTRSPRRRTASLLATAAAAVAVVLGVSVAVANPSTTDGTGTTATQQLPTNPSPGNGSTTPNTNGRTSGTGHASEQQQIGVVDVYTRLKYQSAAAAGTGIVIDSDGFVLTNNHVIQGSTSIRVVVVATGKRYSATVVGTAPTEDVAVLQLKDASGLQTANLGDSDKVQVGDSVTGVGNAGGNGGTPSAAYGSVKSLDETITAADESGTGAERLNGVIATDAEIQSGESGGPMFNADDEVIGIVTAASTNGKPAGFAIPINNAMDLAQQIRSGVETSVVHIGYPAFLGVSVRNTNGAGALIETTEPGLPADKAGISASDTVTELNGTPVTSADTLRAAIGDVDPGDTVDITYVDAGGQSHQTQATLITGPAD